jgi:hypothetical protein
MRSPSQARRPRRIFHPPPSGMRILRLCRTPDMARCIRRRLLRRLGDFAASRRSTHNHASRDPPVTPYRRSLETTLRRIHAALVRPRVSFAKTRAPATRRSRNLSRRIERDPIHPDPGLHTERGVVKRFRDVAVCVESSPCCGPADLGRPLVSLRNRRWSHGARAKPR